MTVLDSFLAGSYARSAMIGPFKDADVDNFVVLDASHLKARLTHGYVQWVGLANIIDAVTGGSSATISTCAARNPRSRPSLFSFRITRTICCIAAYLRAGSIRESRRKIAMIARRYNYPVNDFTITEAVLRAKASAVRVGFAEPMVGNRAGPATYALPM